jgi:CDP-diacylglycerol pyrophosphatase
MGHLYDRRACLRQGLASTVVAIGSILVGCGHGNPNKLWEIVHTQCVPNEEQHQQSAPCAVVDLKAGESNGHVLLKDINGPYQYLLIPTAKLTGIESPELLGEAGSHYFAAAWEGRHLIEQAMHRELPREEVSLAVNSRYGRSQEQLHIHIDCLKPAVQAALHEHLAAVSEHWAPLDVDLEGHRYQARRVTATQVQDLNPFRLLADSSPEVASEMGRHTLVVAGATFEDGSAGFILLDDRASLWPFDRAHGEELQDHLCR